MKNALRNLISMSTMTGIILLLSLPQPNILNAQESSDACQVSPVISCLPTFFGCPGDDISPEAIGRPTATTSSTDCPVPILEYTDTIEMEDSCGTTKIKRLWRAIYPDDANPWLYAECVQIIMLQDQGGPVLSNCPADISVMSGADCRAQVTWDAPTVSGACGSTALVSNINSGAFFEEGSTLVTYTVTDNCGRSSTCSFFVTVVPACCTSAPTITCPAEYSACVGSSIHPDDTGTPTATFADDRCGDPILSYTDEIMNSGPCNGEIIIMRTWKAQHASDSTLNATCLQKISLLDDTNPTIANCPADITVNSDADCRSRVNWNQPTATDNCELLTFESNIAPNTFFEIGTTIVVYTATDACGNQSQCSFNVTVVKACCTEAPIITCADNFSGCVGSSTHPDNTGYATVTSGDQMCDNGILSYIDVIISNGPCDGEMVIERTWKATSPADSSLTATCVQRIELRDNTSPSISDCPMDITLTGTNTTYTWSDPVISDNCSATLSSSVPKGSEFAEGATTVILTATDLCGNEATCSFVITVHTTGTGSSITLTCPEDLVFGCGADEPDGIPLPEVSSDCEMCESGEIPGFINMGTFNGHQYYCSEGQATWQKAKEVCENRGGYLAIINDADENAYLASQLVTSAAFIGLSDRTSEGNFKWVDGSGVTYANWYENQPNNYQGYQDYVELLNSGEWNDQYNNKALEYILEIPCYNITQTEGPTDISEVTGDPTTVTFEVEDMCGNVATCSYSISKETSTSFTCSEDITVQTNNDHAHVSYDAPEFSTCCTNNIASVGGPIEGYVSMGYFNGSYYYCSKNAMTWQNANYQCRKRGGHLAIINSSGENAYLANLLGNQTAYIGHSDHMKEGEFHTVGGHNSTYTNWESGQPNNHGQGQHYVEMNPLGEWNDNYDYFKREYILEIKDTYRIELTKGLPSGAAFPVGVTSVEYTATDGCGNVETCSFDVTVQAQGNNAGNYCESYGKNSSYAHIKKVVLNSVNFPTGNNGGYDHHEGYCLDVHAGGDISVRLSPGFHYYSYYCYWQIFIDFNQDGDFSDEGEKVGKARSTRDVVGEIDIPASAKSGPTRMRIVMSLNDYKDGACGKFDYGEVEDFCIDISGGSGAKKPIHKSAIAPVTLRSQEIEDEKALEKVDFGKVSIFPNPATQSIRFLAEGTEVLSAEIINLEGKRIRKIQDYNSAISIDDLSSGMYYVRIVNLNGEQQIEKLIVE